ncbi:MAG: hypothetical protein Q8936_18440 [Bacillota bacterium]|nr:hypothetical protein [Bacillota bacterium]
MQVRRIREIIMIWHYMYGIYKTSRDKVLGALINKQMVKTIILALGAMSFESKQEKEKLDIFVDAFRKTGMRAIIQGFNKTLTEYQLPKTMISVGSVPHSWLFRQGYCVIHHCGFGTSASSLLYGIPTISVPHVLDQFAFADQLYKLKVSVKPIKANELSEEKLISAINEIKANYSEMHDRVGDLAKKMQMSEIRKATIGNKLNPVESGFFDYYWSFYFFEL